MNGGRPLTLQGFGFKSITSNPEQDPNSIEIWYNDGNTLVYAKTAQVSFDKRLGMSRVMLDRPLTTDRVSF